MPDLNRREPWVSFCMSTYRRPDFLKKSLVLIGTQTFADFEVIVSDNDPEGSAASVVQEMKDERFRYYHNGDNLGMIRSFNKSIERATGQFIVMITDDDPVYPEMLQTLYDLSLQYPGYGMYFGGHNTYFESLPEARMANARVGMVSGLADAELGAIKTFNAADFPLAYLRTEIAGQFLWSTGVVRREIAMEIGGLPDYGVPPLADCGYILLSGSRAGCVCINQALGHRTIHKANHSYSKANYEGIYGAPDRFYKWIIDRLPSDKINDTLVHALQHYVGRDLTVSVILIKRTLDSTHQDSAAFEDFARRFFKLPYLKRWKLKYYISVHFPRSFEFFLALRKLLSPQPKK